MQVDLIVGSSSYSLSDGTYCYFYGIDGAGAPPLHRLRERGPLQHGETDVGFRLDPRLLTLLLTIPASTYSSFWTMRDSLLSLISPIDDAVSLRFTLDNGSVRQLDCNYIAGAGMTASEEAQARLQRVPAIFSASDPTFYDPTINTSVWALTISSDLIIGDATLTTKFYIPFLLGSGTISDSTAVAYAGTWRSYPIFYLTGPMNYPVIDNETTNERLYLQYSIAAGETVVIDCSFDAKTVKSGTANFIRYLSDDSDLATFHIASYPGGSYSNTIRVTATGLTSGTSSIVMQYYTRYIGI